MPKISPSKVRRRHPSSNSLASFNSGDEDPSTALYYRSHSGVSNESSISEVPGFSPTTLHGILPAVVPSYYDDLPGKKVKELQTFILVPEPVPADQEDTSSLHTLPRAKLLQRNPMVTGCQSPCGNLWLAAISMLLEDPQVLKKLKHLNKSKMPGNGWISAETNSFPCRFLLTENAAEALIHAFLSETTGLEKFQGLKEQYAVALKYRLLEGKMRILYCRLEDIPPRARSWLYFIEVKATPNGGNSQFCFQTPLNQPDLLELNILDVVNTPGLIQIGEENSRSSQPRYIATVSSPSPYGYDSEGGFIKVNRQLPYEKLLGLVLTETSQALDGATIFGSHSAWSLDRDHHVVYMPDSDNPGTWYRLLTEASDGAVVLAVPPPGPGSDNASNRILRLVGGSCNPSIMSMVMPSLPSNFKSSRHYNIHGYFAPGMVVNKRRILIGCNSRSHRCCPDGTMAVLDPSAIPTLSPNDSLKFCARRSAPMCTQYWNTRGNTWFGRAAAYRIAANTIVGFILLILAICHGLLDPSGIDSLLVLSVIRIVGDWCTCAIFLYTSVKNHTIEKSEVLPRFLSLRSVDMLLSGVGWSNSKSTISAGDEEAENEDDAPSFWIRRTFIRFRSVVSSIFVSYSMYVLIQHHGGDLPVATITFVATLLVSQTAASFVNGVSLLGALFDEFTGANINGRQMEIFLATSAIIDLIASTLVSVVLYQDTSESMSALFLLAGVWLDSFLYAITLLRARALLSRGLGQEEKALVGIESESTQLVLSTLGQFESSASSAREWGLCAIANHNEYRGLLALFEDFNFCIHANTLSFSLADWVTYTEPNGFRLVPLLHRDGLAYQGQDFDGNLKFLHKKWSTATDFYYGRIRMLYLDIDTPLIWPTFPVQPVIGGNKKNGKKIDLENCPSHPATWNQAPRMTALVFGDANEIIIPLAPTRPGAAAKIVRRDSIPELTDTERSPDNSEV